MQRKQIAEWSQPFQSLPESVFWSRVKPSPLVSPCWVDVNHLLAESVAVSTLLSSDQALIAASGGEPLPEWDPIAQAYSGHQFGQWAGALGDGRGLYLGVSSNKGNAYEWHLKGAGKTPYSRSGDGRAVLRSSIREYLGSEYMNALGVPTTRALALVTSQTPVLRETVEQGATLIRLARSHLRIGHFEHVYHSRRESELRELIQFAIQQLDPELIDQTNPEEVLFDRYLDRSARLVAEWMAVGFVHGVMNTDNTALSGETLDYGPYGFVGHFDPGYVINHTDAQGRYAFGQQPHVMQWNLGCLAECLTSFVGVDTLRAMLASFPERFRHHYRQTMASRLAVTADNPRLDLITDGLASLFSVPGTFYLEGFQWLLLDEPHGLSKRAIDQNKLISLRKIWSEEKEVDLMPKALNLAPSWMLSHWLLEEVISQANVGDYSGVVSLREDLNCGISMPSLYAERFGGSPPSAGSGYHLSCSS
ncbi:YdiU family protein [Litorivicinus sp.]|jgi:uncharacterized protein YdiU (UPF0061 family)|nr:YdiU family protein [Litorivicinus sp.]MDC1207758.1 YdiU family protein [Litorivicinus sp.]MDC1240565.1 YdiU family protein [Litorivicinus sp.]|tara:strand:+ start:7783 stop:9213 length:1431 start_codon:yes stop_codon:yes gene_type:complete